MCKKMKVQGYSTRWSIIYKNRRLERTSVLIRRDRLNELYKEQWHQGELQVIAKSKANLSANGKGLQNSCKY